MARGHVTREKDILRDWENDDKTIDSPSFPSDFQTHKFETTNSRVSCTHVASCESYDSPLSQPVKTPRQGAAIGQLDDGPTAAARAGPGNDTCLATEKRGHGPGPGEGGDPLDFIVFYSILKHI